MAEVSKVGPEEARRLVDHGAQLVDVRVDHEWEAGRIAGASHFELSTLPERTEEIDRDRPIVVYCRGGSRSEMAAEALAGEGFDAVVLEGGLPAWLEQGGPAEPEGAYAAESGEAAAILQARKSPENP
jgi:rhodanese-related sulfurtransferase